MSFDGESIVSLSNFMIQLLYVSWNIETVARLFKGFFKQSGWLLEISCRAIRFINAKMTENVYL